MCSSDLERIGGVRRALIAIGRVRESEDDELAFAFHCANEPADRAYDRERCNTAYLNGAMRFYRPTHVRRGVGMTFKAMGFPATGRMPEATARLAWWWMNRKMPDRPVKSSATAAA